MNFRYSINIIILFFSLQLCAQDNYVDSILQEAKNIQEAKERVDYLNNSAWQSIFEGEAADLIYDEALHQAEANNYPKGVAQVYNDLGVFYTIQAEFDTARQLHQKALEIRINIDDKKGIASSFNNIGNSFLQQGVYDMAIESLDSALSLRKIIKDTTYILQTSFNIATAQEGLGNYDEALTAYYEYLDFSHKTQDEVKMAIGYNAIGNVQIEREDFEQAESAYLKALDIHLRLNQPIDLADVYNNLGVLNFGKKNYNAALGYYEKALEIYETVQEPKKIVANNINIGNSYLQLKKYSKAKVYLEKAYFLALSYGFQDEELRSLNKLGELAFAKKEYYKAEQSFNQALKTSIEVGDAKVEQISYENLANLYKNTGDFKKAFKFKEKYTELRHQRSNIEKEKKFEEIEALFQLKSKTRDIDRKNTEIELQESKLERGRIITNSLIAGAGLLLLIALLIYRANKVLSEKNAIIQKERQRSDNLLLNILPEETAEELKKNGKAKARKYEEVTILFTDFKSFTQVAELLTPEELVDELHLCFKAFDEIITKYGLEKIKTIGDAYMCAAGLPKPLPDHAFRMTKAALEIRDFMLQHQANYKQQNKKSFEIRIGLHTGTVVAGVVGVKKFAYDIWGDAVNLAARMESSGDVGKVNISETTYKLVNNNFDCEYRGKVKAKNKGEVDMYFVEWKA